VYFTCAVASCKRAPFDLAEAESELVAGFLTEYSGMRWSFFFLAEYASMFAVSGIFVILFLGGWNGPIPVFSMWGGEDLVVARLLVVMPFLTRAALMVCVMLWVRGTLPRLRIGQLMRSCLKCLPPFCCAWRAASALWQVFWPAGIRM